MTASRSASRGGSCARDAAFDLLQVGPGLLERFETDDDAVLGADPLLAQLAPAVQVRGRPSPASRRSCPRRRQASRPLRSRVWRGDGSRPPASFKVSEISACSPLSNSLWQVGHCSSAPLSMASLALSTFLASRSSALAFPLCMRRELPQLLLLARAAPAPPAPGPRRRRGPRGPPRARRPLPAPPRYDSSASRTLLAEARIGLVILRRASAAPRGWPPPLSNSPAARSSTARVSESKPGDRPGRRDRGTRAGPRPCLRPAPRVRRRPRLRCPRCAAVPAGAPCVRGRAARSAAGLRPAVSSSAATSGQPGGLGLQAIQFFLGGGEVGEVFLGLRAAVLRRGARQPRPRAGRT